jgi:hypothetical protein
LASSLGTFFEVDPDAIKLNLLSHTKIALHHVQLKPQKTHKRTLQGEVDEIEFCWIWGGNGKTSFVRETQLTIRGARFRLVISPEEETLPELNSSGVPPSGPSKTQGDGYMQRQVQQIIDHLALHITDFQLAIETGLENFIFEAKSLQLVSLGYSSDETSEAPPLSQQIFLESFCAYLTESPGKKVDSWSRLPLLGPFMYISSIRRVSGRRFDGLVFGLEVVGELASGMKESSENVEGITIHAGTAQVQALGRLLDMLAPEDSHQAVPSCNDKDGSDKFTEEQNGSGGDEDVTETDNEPASTSFVMSFPCIELILPNDSKIRMPNCTLRYCMDGTMCTVEGNEGIMINDFNFLLLEDDARWLVDFARSIFLLEKRLVTIDGEETEPWHDAVADFAWLQRKLWLEFFGWSVK